MCMPYLTLVIMNIFIASTINSELIRLAGRLWSKVLVHVALLPTYRDNAIVSCKHCYEALI
jgi:hypothetical protein